MLFNAFEKSTRKMKRLMTQARSNIAQMFDIQANV